MRLRNVVAGLVGAVVLVAPGAALGDTLIGQFSDGNVQAANSGQTGINGSGGGEFNTPATKFVPGNSAPNLSQTSTNIATNDALVGGGGGEGTLIGNGSQLNTQGINSEQAAKKGTQVSTNVESGTQIIGLRAGDAIIGSPSQNSDQGENSSQSAASPPGPAAVVVLGTNKAPLTETSTNLLISCEAVIGGPGC